MNPVKYLNKDLRNKPVPFDVWLQGTVERTIGDSVIISDSTGDVKLSGCDFKDVTVGAYCCVLGVAVNTDDLPEVKSAKFFKVSNNPTNHQRSWELEVQESQLFLEGMVAPKI